MGEWLRARERSLGRLREHARRGLVDPDIVDWLLEVNERHECIFTTSSCSGRVAVIEAASLFDKRGARILAAWHLPGECRERAPRLLAEASARAGAVWLSLQPPIIHFAALTIEAADRLVACALEAGFTRACYRRGRHGWFHVEVAARDKLAVLPAAAGLAGWACGALERYKERLHRFQECVLSREICG